MKPKSTKQIKNRLALFRRRSLMERKHVATLLGSRTTGFISRFEKGDTLPSLKSALKLAVLYKVPIRLLLDGYFEQCREEIRREEAKLQTRQSPRSDTVDEARDQEFCSYEEKLSSKIISELDLDKIRKHTAELIRKRGETLNHY